MAQKSSPASSLQRSQMKTSLQLKVWEGRGYGTLSPLPSLLNPLPVLSKHTSVRYDRVSGGFHTTILYATHSFQAAMKVHFDYIFMALSSKIVE